MTDDRMGLPQDTDHAGQSRNTYRVGLSPNTYRVGLSHDIFRPDGAPVMSPANYDKLAEAGCIPVPLPETRAFSPADLAGLDAVIVRTAQVPGDTLEAAAKDGFRHVARFGAGYDKVDIGAANRAGVAVTTTPDAVTRPIAVANITLMLTLLAQVSRFDAMVRAGRWAERGSVTALTPTGRTLGIVGLGRIGKETARLALGLGMRVVACTGSGTGGAEGVEMMGLDAVIARSDVLCLACPLTETNRGMMGAAQFAAMKPGAYFVNTARGGLVDETALHAALTEGPLAGAALDVFETEPVAADNPLLGLDNVLLSPHAVGTSDEMFNVCWLGCIDAVTAIRDGRPPASLITDPPAG